jgi:hypothetical protein
VSPDIVPVPLSENGQLDKPGIAPLPLMVMVTVLPLIWPVPVPVMFALPRHVAVNEPEMSVSVWLPTVHTKFEHEPLVADGLVAIVLDDQVLSSDGIAALGSSTLSDVGVGAGVVELERFTSQPASVTAAATKIPGNERANFIWMRLARTDV